MAIPDAANVVREIRCKGGIIRLNRTYTEHKMAIAQGLVLVIEYESEKWRTVPGWRKGAWLILDEALC